MPVRRGRRAVRGLARPPTAAPGRAGHDRDVLLLPVEEPRRVRRRRCGHDERRRARRAGAACCASTAPRTRSTFELVGHNSRLDELQAAILRVLLPHLDALVRRASRRRGRATSDAGLGELVRAAARRAGQRPRVAPLRGARRAPRTRSPDGLRAAGIGHKVYYRVPGAPPAGDGEWGAGGRAAGHRGARAHAPGDPDEPRAVSASRPARSSPRSARPASSTNRLLRMRRRITPRGPPGPPPLAAPDRAGRGAGRAGLLPRLPRCASTGGRPERLPASSSSTRSSFVVIGSVVDLRRLRPLPALDALLVAARVPADRAGGRRPRCSRSSPTSRSSSRSWSSPARRAASSSVDVPTGVLVLYGLLTLVFLGGVALRRAPVLRAPARAASARARGARSVLIVGAGDGGRLLLREIVRNPDLGYAPRRLRRRRPAQAGRARRPRPRRARHDRRAARACSRTSSPTRC